MIKRQTNQEENTIMKTWDDQRSRQNQKGRTDSDERRLKIEQNHRENLSSKIEKTKQNEKKKKTKQILEQTSTIDIERNVPRMDFIFLFI